MSQNTQICQTNKIPIGRSICSKVQNLACVFDFLPDSNSNFRPARKISALITGRMVSSSRWATGHLVDSELLGKRCDEMEQSRR